MPAVTAKKKCCQDKPRCKRCPLVLMRLDKGGYAERESRREYVVDKRIPKKALAAARTR